MTPMGFCFLFEGVLCIADDYSATIREVIVRPPIRAVLASEAGVKLMMHWVLSSKSTL